MRVQHLLVFVMALAVSACSATYGAVPPKEASPAKTNEPVKPVVVDLSNSGHPVQLDKEIEIKGYQTVWVEGTTLLVTLLKTRWDEMGEGGKSTRVGRATFKFQMGDQSKDRTIEEGETKTMMGYQISVKLAYEIYQDDGRWSPHTKFIISK